VDDDARLGQGGASFVVEAQTVLADVTGNGPDPPGHLVREAVTQLLAGPVEAVVLDDFPGQAGAGRIRTVISASGIERRMRSTSAVPKKPVAPVTKKRLPRSSRSMGIRIVYHRPPILSTIW
jgi:hypothetical protein